MSRLYTGINWQYFKDPNDVNDAIESHDANWEGLTDAHDIISITYDSNHGNYVVFWRCPTRSKNQENDN